MEHLVQKLTSRKFLTALTGIITGVLGIANFSDSDIAVIAFVAIEAISILAYIIGESKVDSASVQASINLADLLTQIYRDVEEDGVLDMELPKDLNDHLVGAPVDDLTPPETETTTSTTKKVRKVAKK